MIKLPFFPPMGRLRCSIEPNVSAVELVLQSRLGEFQMRKKYLLLQRKGPKLEQHREHSFEKSCFTLLHPVFCSRQALLLKGNNGVLNQQTFPPRQFLGQLMAHTAL